MLAWFDTFRKTGYGAILLLIIRVAIGALFVYASIDKILHPGEFAEAIYNYRLLPEDLLHISAILLPWAEFFCGIMLIMNVYPRTTSALIFLMLLLFTLAVISAMARGLDFSCGCFKVSNDTQNMGIGKVFENLGMLLMAALSWLNARPEQSD